MWLTPPRCYESKVFWGKIGHFVAKQPSKKAILGSIMNYSLPQNHALHRISYKENFYIWFLELFYNSLIYHS